MPAGGLLGAAALAVAVASWSLAPVIVSRAAARERLDPLAFNGWRMLVAAAATLPLAVLLEGFPWRVPWLDPWFQLGVWLGGVAGSIFGDSLFVYSVSLVGAGVAMPVSYLFVLWTALADYAAGRAGPLVLAAAVLAVSGVALVSTGGGGRDAVGRVRLRGVAAAVGASLIWAGSMYAYQAALERAGPLSVAEARAAFMAAVLAPWMLRWRGWRRVLPELVSSSMLGYVVGSIAFLYALALMPASVVGVGLAGSPVLSQLLSPRLAGERLTPRLLAGGLLVAAAVALVAASRAAG